MKTSFPKPEAPEWYVVDAKDQVLGRLAARLATVLAGKHRPSYVPHWPTGDHVVVINAGQIAFTGRKREQKKYYHHTGYFGGLKEESLEHMLEKEPGRALQIAVKGMLAKNPTRERLLKHLHVYPGAGHMHAPQKPSPLPL